MLNITTKSIMEIKEKELPIISSDQLLAHWQGHRQLTRRVIEAFPEDQLFSFSVGGMRPFSDLAKELLGIAVPGIKGMATDVWEPLDENMELNGSKSKLLEEWDKATGELDEWWSKIPLDHFQDTVVAFGQYEDKVYCSILYFIDNEIHHRAQGYVYLRALGIAPPNFWER
ncbi:DinB family protein [Cognataquiflexum aquatile]|uniref:DinB family protein n=1 Tax=Cognataquiflexum aquatile TaxID=2249427 RepID=UPI001E5E2239|nr:DinB family protein [Cognataquiflexum aquatile]